MAFLFYIVIFPYHKNTAKNKNYTYYSPKQETFFSLHPIYPPNSSQTQQQKPY